MENWELMILGILPKAKLSMHRRWCNVVASNDARLRRMRNDVRLSPYDVRTASALRLKAFSFLPSYNQWEILSLTKLSIMNPLGDSIHDALGINSWRSQFTTAQPSIHYAECRSILHFSLMTKSSNWETVEKWGDISRIWIRRRTYVRQSSNSWKATILRRF